jgi:hypothetical protein
VNLLPRAYEIRRELERLIVVTLLLFWSPITWAQVAQVPTVVTRVPINVTQASATLRAEVNPNGLDTNVELLLLSMDRETIVRNTTVPAGNGTASTIVEFRVSGLTPYSSYFVKATATNSAGSTSGLLVYLSLKGPSQVPEGRDYSGYPMVAYLPVTEVTEHSALIRVEINPNGWPTWVSANLGFGVGAQIRFVNIGELNIAKSELPVTLEFPAHSLYQGMTYSANVSTIARFPDGSGGGVASDGQTFSTLGEPGHNPPDVKNVAVRVPLGSTQSVTRVVEGFDADGDTFQIESVSQPQHGTVTIDVLEWTYTPDASYDGTDQFSITVLDSAGERATMVVQIYDVRPRAFEFDLPLGWKVTDPPRPAGRVKLSATAAGAFTGKATIFGADYPFHGSFDQFGEAVVEFDRVGLPPLVANLKLLPMADGEMHFSAEIEAPELSSPYVAEGLPVGNAETSAGVGGLQYTAVLPLQSLATTPSPAGAATLGIAAATSETPQGDGFLIGKVGKTGRAKFVGRTGDGQTFTIGGRLQRNRKLSVAVSAGGQPRDYIVGQLEFTRDETKSVGGTLGWLSYRRQNEFYSQDFTRLSQPKGAAYRKPGKGTNAFGEIGLTTTLRLRLLDDTGASLIDLPVSVNASGNAQTAEGNPLAFHLDLKSGAFRGAIRLNAGISPTPTKFRGAIVQSLKQGQGHVLLNGPVGAAMITASAE